MGIEYAREKFYLAARGMALSERPLWERIADAWTYNLINVHKEDLPPELAKRFSDLRTQCTRLEAKEADEGTLRATLRSLSEQEIQEIGESLMNLHDEILEPLTRD